MSLDQQRHADAGGDDTVTLADRIADDDPNGDPADAADRAALAQLLAEAIAALPERERHVIVGHYGRGETLQQIGMALGVSGSRISQLHSRALRLLRELLADLLADRTQPTRPPSIAARPQRPRLAMTALNHVLLRAA
jgi:RNA polymerase sigma factor for flagellar operon FliA